MAATGKDHATVNLALWGDDDFLDLTVDEQMLYFTLWTSPGLSYCGAGTWHPGRIANLAADWTRDRIEYAAAGLSRALFLLIDTDTDEFLLRSWIKHDGLWRIPNMAVSMANARADIASRALRGVIVHEVLKLKEKHPESKSWARAAVESMLEQNAVAPEDLPPFTPTATPALTPSATPAVTPPLRVNPNPCPNPPSTPAPAPAPFSNSKKRGAHHPEKVTTPTPETPPPKTCSTHWGMTDIPPCRDCATAREQFEAWETHHHAVTVNAEIQQRREAAETARIAIDACTLCDHNGYRPDPDTGRPGSVCDHDPHTVERNARGIAQVRAALAAKGIE